MESVAHQSSCQRPEINVDVSVTAKLKGIMTRICRLLFVNRGATHDCLKVDAQKHPENSKIRKSRQRTGSLQIQTPPHTSTGS